VTLLSTLGARVRLDARARRALALAAAALLLVVALAAVAAAGGPRRLVDRAKSSFQAPLPESGGDLNRRLVSLSSNGRSEYWRVASREIREHPWLGGGAGSYERYWHRERRTGYEARNAHNLYLETLAELGPVGLALLLTALGAPLVAVFRMRTAYAAAAASAYTAFLVHAAVDWDWQIPAVTLAALACAAVLVARTRSGAEGPPTTWRSRATALVLLLSLAAAAIVTQAGNSALAASATAAARGKPAEAERLGHRARRWAPWSSQPWQRIGEAQVAAGDLQAARNSFRHAIRLNDKDWNIWYELAEASAEVAALRRGD
jgi:tetratricopeptide (TPR) repeat protein